MLYLREMHILYVKTLLELNVDTKVTIFFFNNEGQQVMNNNMMKILVKKGVLVDLARIPHSLDLSSPFLAPTINAVLKPLETLSRSVNSPDKFVSMKKSSADHNTTAPDQGGTTTQVVTEPALSNGNFGFYLCS